MQHFVSYRNECNYIFISFLVFHSIVSIMGKCCKGNVDIVNKNVLFVCNLLAIYIHFFLFLTITYCINLFSHNYWYFL